MDPAMLDRLHNTSGGDSDTELNEFAVRPTSVPSPARAVTTVTPVANMPNALRNSAWEKLGGIARWGLTFVSIVAIYLISGNLQYRHVIQKASGCHTCYL
jgi:hypothetical protein